jgi:type I restriction enzyme, S subunit
MTAETLPLSAVLRLRDELPDPEEVVSGKIRIVSKIGFNDGKIVLRATTSTNTDMIVARPGDLVLSGINAAKGAIAIQDSTEPVAATIHYSAFAINRHRADTRYLWWYLRSKAFRERLLSSLPNGIKTEVKPKRLLPIEVQLPSLERQCEIVEKLDAIATKVQEAAALHADGTLLLGTAMSSFIEDAMRNVGHLGRFEEVLLLKPRSGPAFPTSSDWEGTPVLMPGSVTGFGVDLSKVEYGMGDERVSPKDRLEVGDVLIARGNKRDQVGNAGVVPQQAVGWVCANLLMRMQLNPAKADPHFCIYWFRSPLIRAAVKKAMKGTNPNIQKINQRAILSFPFPTCLTVDEQRRIVQYLDRLQSDVDGLNDCQRERESLLSQIVPRLVSDVFQTM